MSYTGETGLGCFRATLHTKRCYCSILLLNESLVFTSVHGNYVRRLQGHIQMSYCSFTFQFSVNGMITVGTVATLFAFPLVFQRLFALESQNFNTIKPHQSATHPHCCNTCTYDYIHTIYT